MGALTRLSPRLPVSLGGQGWCSALHYAAWHGHGEAAVLLAERGGRELLSAKDAVRGRGRRCARACARPWECSCARPRALCAHMLVSP
jgi:hypothetical protein